MSEFSSNALPSVTPDPDAEARAQQVVLRRAVDEGWTRGEVEQVLAALGITPTESAGAYGGQRRRVESGAVSQSAAIGPNAPSQEPCAAVEGPEVLPPTLNDHPLTKHVSDATTRSS